METNQPSSSYPSRPPSRQNKVLSQREYREREMESFNTLRDIINILTGEELRTRQEILKKAIDLLLSLSGIGNQSGARTGSSNLHGLSPPTSELEVMPLAHSASPSTSYPAETSHWPQIWPSNTEFGTVTPDYGTQLHQQHRFTPTTDSTFDQFDSLGPGGSYSYH